MDLDQKMGVKKLDKNSEFEYFNRYWWVRLSFVVQFKSIY